MFHPSKQQLLRIAIGVVLTCVLVELLALAAGLPHIPAIIRGWWSMASNGTLQHDCQVSGARWLIGWAIGAGCGTALGLVTGRIPIASFSLEGFLTILRSIPFICLVPLSLRLVGIAESGKIFLLAWLTGMICWVGAHEAGSRIPRQMEWLAESLRMSRAKRIQALVLPACRSGIYAALRTSLLIGLIAVAVTEMSGVYERSTGYWWSEGLGYRLFRSLDQSRDDLLLATILTFTVLGAVADRGFVVAIKLFDTLAYNFRRHRTERMLLTLRHSAHQADGTEQPASSPARLVLNNVSAGYGPYCVVKDLSLDVPQGKILCLLGRSGCGKTTLLRAIARLGSDSIVTSGSIDLLVNVTPTRAGIVFQGAPVFEGRTVWENITIGGRFSANAACDKATGLMEAFRLLEEFGLTDLATRRTERISGGQRQRVAIATALVNNPNLILFDEPLASLDAITRRDLLSFLRTHLQERITGIWVTHSVDEALLIGDLVRVGVDKTGNVSEVNRGGRNDEMWELSDQFRDLKRALTQELECRKGDGRDDRAAACLQVDRGQRARPAKAAR